jgi:hypothetical protein
MKGVPEIRIALNQEMYLELIDAAAECYQGDERGCSVEDFAKEAVESVLATRRLERMALL